MKILLVCNYYQPQLGYGESEVAKNLLALGHEVQIITGDRYFPFPNYEETVKKTLGSRYLGSSVVEEQGMFVTRKHVYAEFFARTLFLGIKNKINDFQPDEVIVFGISTPACVQVALIKKMVKSNKFKLVVVDSHLPSELNSGIVIAKSIFYYIFRTFFAKLINDQADKIIAVQEDTKKVIKEYYGLKKPAQLISHGADTNLFNFSQKFRTKLRHELKVFSTDFVIIYTGKIIPSKGVDILISAWELLNKKFDNIHLLLVGSGSGDYLLGLLNANMLNNNKFHQVEFINRDQLYKYYSAADVAVWPLQESLSMVDAAACSLPFIANHELGARERIGNKNALLYLKGDAQDLAAKIELLYHNKKARLLMGKRGRSLIENKLSWIKVAKKYL